MGSPDILVASVILAGASYLLYRSLWKKKGHCHGCSGCGSGAPDTVQLRRPRSPPDSRG